MITATQITNLPNSQGVVEVQPLPPFQRGGFVTLQKAFEVAIEESGGRIEVRPRFLSGKPKLVGKRVGVDSILYALADTLSFQKTQDGLILELDEIQAALEFAAAVCEQEVESL